MIEIQQAVFGEGRDRGHALLGSSYRLDTIPNQLSGFTDLVDRPRDGELTHPIVRGFIAKEHFVLVRSFPDITGRQGRVFSHALILKKEDYLKVHDITELLEFLMPAIDKNAELNTIQYTGSKIPQVGEPTKEDHIATQGLANHLKYDNTIVWLLEVAYWQWISRIWNQLPPTVKLNLRLGAAFNPNKINKDVLNLVFLADASKQNWQREPYLVVVETQNFDSSDKLNDYLLGNAHQSEALLITLNELHLQITEVDDLQVINNYAEVFVNLHKKQPVKKLLMLSALMARYNANPKSAADSKEKILASIANSLLDASATEIAYLENQTWAGFETPSVLQHVGTALRAWYDKHLLNGQTSLDKSKLVTTAVKLRKTNWWHGFTKDYIMAAIKSWRAPFSNFLWDWVKTDMDVVTILFPHLPDRAENDIIRSIPSLDKTARDIVLKHASERKWFFLYGLTAISHYPSNEAFDKVYSLKGVSNLYELLGKMASTISDEQLIYDATKLNYPELNKIATAKIIKTPALKKHLKLDSAGWQNLLLQSTKDGLLLWTGIKDVQKILFEIMDILLNGGSFNAELLTVISKEKNLSLKNYGSRATIWTKLNQNVKNAFLSATLADCLNDVANGKMTMSDLEKPLLDGLTSADTLKEIITDGTMSATFKLNLLIPLSAFGEYEASMLVWHNSFAATDALNLGTYIRKKGWRELAKQIYDSRKTRPDLAECLSQCSTLLGFWERLTLAASGFESTIVHQNERWEMLLNKVIEHYPDGPNQNGIWENAGGNRSELHVSGSGKQIWTSAIIHIKNGGKPKAKKLLSIMIEEFPFDDSLKQLKELL